MKGLATVLLIFISFPGIAQIIAPLKLSIDTPLVFDRDPGFLYGYSLKATKSNKQHPSEVDIFIDSIKMNKNNLYYFDPTDIENYDVYRNSQYRNGVVWITLKDHALLVKLLKDKHLSLNDISKMNIPDFEKQNHILYILNDKLLTDTAGVRIPSLCVSEVTVIKSSENTYLNNTLPGFLLVMITTHSIGTKPSIMLRGTAEQKLPTAN